MSIIHPESLLKYKFLLFVVGLVILTCVFDSVGNGQVGVNDAFFLMKNTIIELQEGYLKGDINIRSIKENIVVKFHGVRDKVKINDAESPFISVLGSLVPLDGLITLNTTDEGTGNITTNEILGRFASFSPVFLGPVAGNYKIFPGDACSSINADDYEEYKNEVLIILRGNCSFMNKVDNVDASDLAPSALIIANDEPGERLVTMYSSRMDMKLYGYPILFISNESYKLLKNFEADNLIVEITALLFGCWLNIIISILFSPPLLILLFFLIIKGVGAFKSQRNSYMNKRLVHELPVFIYNANHLIDLKDINEYLKITGISQTSDVPEINQSDSNSTTSNDATSTMAESEAFVVNGVDVRQIRQKVNLLICPDDFYTSSKCSICLEKYVLLKSRVIVLGCRHFFHERCLSNWLIHFKRRCPLCCKPVNNPKERLLFSESHSTYGSLEEDLENPSPRLLETQNMNAEHPAASRSAIISVSNSNSTSLNDLRESSSLNSPEVHNSDFNPPESHDSSHLSVNQLDPSSNPNLNKNRDERDSSTNSSLSFYSASSFFANKTPIRLYSSPSQVLARISQSDANANEGDSADEIDMENYCDDVTSGDSPSDTTIHIANLSNVS